MSGRTLLILRFLDTWDTHELYKFNHLRLYFKWVVQTVYQAVPEVDLIHRKTHQNGIPADFGPTGTKYLGKLHRAGSLVGPWNLQRFLLR